jgi:hypothetical protein
MPKKHKQGHNMPIKCQISNIRKILERANPEWEKITEAYKTEGIDELPTTSPGGRPDTCHWEIDLDEGESFSNNLDTLKTLYPLLKWKVPKMAENKAQRSKDEIFDKEEGVLVIEERKNGPKRRMQITLGSYSRNRYALVQIYLSNSHVETEQMNVAKMSHFLYQHDHQLAKLLENRKIRPKSPKRKDIIPDEEGILIRTEITIKPHPPNYGIIQISDKNLASGRYALVQVFLPYSDLQIEGMPHTELNRSLKDKVFLYELAKKLKPPLKPIWARENDTTKN